MCGIAIAVVSACKSLYIMKLHYAEMEVMLESLNLHLALTAS